MEYVDSFREDKLKQDKHDGGYNYFKKLGRGKYYKLYLEEAGFPIEIHDIKEFQPENSSQRLDANQICEILNKNLVGEKFIIYKELSGKERILKCLLSPRLINPERFLNFLKTEALPLYEKHAQMKGLSDFELKKQKENLSFVDMIEKCQELLLDEDLGSELFEKIENSLPQEEGEILMYYHPRLLPQLHSDIRRWREFKIAERVNMPITREDFERCKFRFKSDHVFGMNELGKKASNDSANPFSSF